VSRVFEKGAGAGLRAQGFGALALALLVACCLALALAWTLAPAPAPAPAQRTPVCSSLVAIIAIPHCPHPAFRPARARSGARARTRTLLVGRGGTPQSFRGLAAALGLALMQLAQPGCPLAQAGSRRVEREAHHQNSHPPLRQVWFWLAVVRSL
jgi:hypothetical protein